LEDLIARIARLANLYVANEAAGAV
jgi:hypothetical protein